MSTTTVTGHALRTLWSDKASPWRKQKGQKREPLTIYEKAVLMGLADSMRDKATGWPAIDTLASWCSMSRAMTKRTLKDLCKRGILARSKRPRKPGQPIKKGSWLWEYRAGPKIANPGRTVTRSHGDSVTPRPRTRPRGDPGPGHAVTPKQKVETKTETETLSRACEGKLIHEAVCPSCEKTGHLTQSPGRNGHPPGFWCRRPPGCGTNFPIDFAEIFDQLTPGARRSIEAVIATSKSRPVSKAEAANAAADEAVDAAFQRIKERGVFLPKQRRVLAQDGAGPFVPASVASKQEGA